MPSRSTIWKRCKAGMSLEDARKTPVMTPLERAKCWDRSSSIAEQARRRGLCPKMVQQRVRKGETLEAALSYPSRLSTTRGRLFRERVARGWSEHAARAPVVKGAMIALCATAGQNYNTVYGRLARGETLEQALTPHLTANEIRWPRGTSIAAQARAAGHPPSRVYMRMRLGYSKDAALASGVLRGPGSLSLRARAIAAGVNPATARGRLRRGYPIEVALSKCLLPSGPAPNPNSRRSRRGYYS
jgi:hypothetical protein